MIGSALSFHICVQKFRMIQNITGFNFNKIVLNSLFTHCKQLFKSLVAVGSVDITLRGNLHDKCRKAVIYTKNHN